ncbi:hypothetical protein [Prescottella agglutinans]|uniref:Secreted protein n=1 Tax=Prescottella agglutinans TaxID=1644129 RepID=A0ABT6MGF3_9NOCA|nr:hypothetical protein [Prescottella agglutinans]MDH6283315.1 hypothetical protein [Prescottella agglutinans]
MRRAAIHRAFVARAAASVAVLALPLCSSVAATASPPPVPATTTAFQVPVRYVAGCLSEILMCWNPTPLISVTPSATTGAPGAVTFAPEPPTATPEPPTGICVALDITVNWRNLTTGAEGTTVLRHVVPDYSRSVAPDGWCRYGPATVSTGSGMVAATADVGAPLPAPAYQILITPGLGTFQVP